VKLLLTSAGVQNPSIEAALVELVGRPIAESTALAIPTAAYSHPSITPDMSLRFLTGESTTPMVDLGWKSVGILELTALDSIGPDRWQKWVSGADALLASGGDALYLAHWMRKSGLADFLTTQPNLVWVGLSAGSMAMTPRVGTDFVERWLPPEGGDEALGLVDFSIFPHLDHPMLPENTMANAERWAEEIGGAAYAIDDATAIRVVDGTVDVISEGHWRKLRDGS